MKIFSATLIALASLVMGAPALAAQGDVVRTASSSPFALDARSERLAFPDEFTWQTWGQPEAKKVDDASIAKWKVRGVMPLREGSALVKFGTDPDVYAVGPNGVLHKIDRPSIAEKLYGADWSKKVRSLFSSFWVNYKFGTVIDNVIHPEGTLFKYSNSSKIYYMTNGLMRPFASESAFKANRFNTQSVITVPDSVKYLLGNPIIGYERDLADAVFK